MDDLKPGDKITTIPLDAIIKIPISGAFYARIQQAFFALLQEKMPEDPTGYKLNERLKELQTRDPEDLWEQQVTIYLALLYAAEESGREQGVLKEEAALDFVPKDASPEVSPES